MGPSVDALPSSALIIQPNEPGNEALAPGSSRQPQTKRNRIQLSCTHCRHAKLKCDREKPCSQCIKKGRASLCSFPAPAIRKKPAVSMQNRLKHLESLVKGVMTGPAPNGGSSDVVRISQTNDSPAVAPQYRTLAEAVEAIDGVFSPLYKNDGQTISSGQVVLGPNESKYVGATHWAAIINDVRFRSVRSFGHVQLMIRRLKK